jgi:hypothetical protein
MLITRRQALRNSTFALGGAVLAPQLAQAETAASKPSGQNAGIYRLKLGAFEVTVLSDGSFTLPSPLLATNLAEAELKEFVKANHIGGDTFRTQINVVLVNTGERRVLIDAGAGGLAATHDGPSPGQSKGRRHRAERHRPRRPDPRPSRPSVGRGGHQGRHNELSKRPLCHFGQGVGLLERSGPPGLLPGTLAQHDPWHAGRLQTDRRPDDADQARHRDRVGNWGGREPWSHARAHVHSAHLGR